MIVVAEPTYHDHEHAPVNGAILHSIALACGPVVFAATPLHHASVREAASLNAPIPTRHDIVVLPSGGIHVRRMRAQWLALAGLMRTYAPHTLVLLSAGPETLFVARALVTRYRKLHLFVVTHGNLVTATGWRSRDPRHRLIDMRSSLAVARHPRIHLIVLETHIRESARRIGLPHNFLVWPHPLPTHEVVPFTPWVFNPRLRLAFVGQGTKPKGFDDFLAMYRSVGPKYDWALVGKLDSNYNAIDLGVIDFSYVQLSRAEFLSELRKADFAVLSLRADYDFIASGSLLDCIAQRKPLIAVETTMLAGLTRQYGQFGYLCPDLPAVEALLADPARLRDPAAYAKFQRVLDAMHHDRAPETLAIMLRRDLQC